ncbi:pentapeptide repeat-containing protein [Spirosoma flavum]|uniref:Pentapeptide repeat-containing protein n=1 Tax=Spirosoma flavum TaxID=2048557 RepID=A0ABW6AFC5_9BACT
MKTILTFLLFAFTAIAPTLAQTTVDAKDIIAKINRKETISYQNATITGDLDLTSLANRHEVREGSWKGDSPQFLSVVEVPLSFKNCKFQGKFLAYRTEDQDRKFLKVNNTVYNTNFTEAVTIEGCQFADDAAFKYSTFSQRAIFTNNAFRNGALFKYAKFSNEADFSGSTFQDYADFKYTNFNESSSFQKVTFERYADFKYAKFDERVDFGQARFTNTADFKYTKLPRGTNFDDARFSGSTDFKYATLDGRKFSPTSR